ncbi:hypothetical protein BDW02DRAFT_600420 [Decorospora gaudefroyi]|uniref:Uncharacterized protein n=1 Tax=Decorospora gaudefroyi TaxID=184978 RepID=A0A6A5K3X0_9PLEO|nr:hypothetical protein BDW02DRAFT_600420 [Decorospora gaudefroyi]
MTSSLPMGKAILDALQTWINATFPREQLHAGYDNVAAAAKHVKTILNRLSFARKPTFVITSICTKALQRTCIHNEQDSKDDWTPPVITRSRSKRAALLDDEGEHASAPGPVDDSYAYMAKAVLRTSMGGVEATGVMSAQLIGMQSIIRLKLSANAKDPDFGTDFWLMRKTFKRARQIIEDAEVHKMKVAYTPDHDEIANQSVDRLSDEMDNTRRQYGLPLPARGRQAILRQTGRDLGPAEQDVTPRDTTAGTNDLGA